MKELQINKTGIVIRPSAIDTYLNCSYKWAKTYLEGVNSFSGARAAIGTGIHGGVETMWNHAIETGQKDLNLTAITDASIDTFRKEIDGKEIQYDNGEDQNTAEKEIVNGTVSFVEDIAVYAPIPVAVEKRFSVEICDHPVISGVSGTVDYLTFDTIADVKTSKRKPSPPNYKTQQSTYKLLAEENGLTINSTLIQGVVLKKVPESMVLPIETDTDQARFIINSILDTVRIAAEGNVPLEVLFRGNPKYYLCSPKYCALYNDCPFVTGDIDTASKTVKKAIEL